MSESSNPASGLKRACFEKTCAYCGSLFNVELSRQSGANPQRTFACPECGKHYAVLSALPPKVRLIHPRSDGKSSGYQETMF